MRFDNSLRGVVCALHVPRCRCRCRSDLPCGILFGASLLVADGPNVSSHWVAHDRML